MVIAGVFIIAIHSIKYEQTASVELKLPTKKPAPKKFYSPLTGVEIANEAIAKLPVTGVMIENSPAARPQSGLKKAGVVYEAVAEGGITRFLALYQGRETCANRSGAKLKIVLFELGGTISSINRARWRKPQRFIPSQKRQLSRHRPVL